RKKVEKVEKMIVRLEDGYKVIGNEMKNEECSILKKVEEVKRVKWGIGKSVNRKIFDQEFKRN
uniref:hypothetical protein n=1 Tax=Bacillus altitudinis TaxID=293387 RepID=UPI001C93097E